MSIITISRLYGSGGSEVGAIVAKELGWSLLDNAVVDEVAARLGVTRAEVEAREEKAPTLAQRLVEAIALGSQDWLSPLSAQKREPTDEQLVRMTSRIVDEAIARGPVVLVGRGAQAMLAARTDALHVFTYAPRSALIARSMARDGLNEHDAAKHVDSTNSRREQWVRQHWNRAWKDYANYHLALNTEWLGIAGAADLIVYTARKRFTTTL